MARGLAMGMNTGLLSPQGRASRGAAFFAVAAAAALALAACALLAVNAVTLLADSSCCAQLGDAGTGLFWGDAEKGLQQGGDEESDRKGAVGDGEDAGLHAEAENALALCDELVAEGNVMTADGKRRRCVHRALKDTRYTGTLAGQNNWEQNSMAISLQKVIDQFQPDMDHLMKNGKLSKVPVYDRSSFRGHQGTGTAGAEIFDPDQTTDEYVAMAALGIKSNDKESAWEKDMGYDQDPYQQPVAKRARPQKLSLQSVKRKGRKQGGRKQGLWEVMPTYEVAGASGGFPDEEPYFPSVTQASGPAPVRVEEMGRDMSPPVHVEEAIVVAPRRADDAHLTRQTAIALDPERGEPQTFKVDVEGVPVGCGAPAGTEAWSGVLTVEDASCGDGVVVSDAD